MKHIFDAVSQECSKLTTRTYSTSFSLGIYFLNKKLHPSIYSIYGFVRLADEIVDSFHGFNKKELLGRFRRETAQAIEEKISLNPILNSFQSVVNEFNIEWELIDTFLKSMEMDLNQSDYDDQDFETYILGSAEVVGLMCLRVFVNNKEGQFEELKVSAMKLGSAFQKVNFLRDLKADFEGLGRSYFPGIDLANFDTAQKKRIEQSVLEDFDEALDGIRRLPKSSRQGVYLAYIYYKALYRKITGISAEKIMEQRIRIPNRMKFGLMINSVIRNKLNVL